MPAGDAQRAWFPEMLETLKKKWNPSLCWDDCIVLCRDATKQRQKIRKKKGITGPRMWCKNCNAYHNMSIPPVGIRSMLYALRKLDLLDDSAFELKDKEWKKYQRKNKLDATGKMKKPKQNQSAPAKTTCATGKSKTT